MSDNLVKKEQTGERKVLDAEIIDHDNESAYERRQQWQNRFGPGVNSGYARYWVSPAFGGNGCLGPAITFAFFLVCLSRFGVLAAIGFLVFYTIGAIFGAFSAASRLMNGRPAYPWLWRSCNWTISFFLTVWLAGGFNN